MRLFGRFALPFDSKIRLVALPALAAALLVGCGGGDDGPAQVNGPEPMVVPDGTFAVTAAEIINQCGQPNTYNADFELTINGDSFTMGDDWTGTWDAIEGNARGESDHDVTTNPRGCTVRIWTEVSVAFTSADEFGGTIIYRRRVNEKGECNTDCLATWGISGVRN